MANKITLKGLAQILGISVSTVSKALADSPEISDSTKVMVKAAAREHKYRPNALARGLKYKRTKTLGIIIPDILANFFAKVVVGIEDEAEKNGYSLITCLSRETLTKEDHSLKMLSDAGADAILLSVSRETQVKGEVKHLNDTLHYDIPLIMFDRVSEKVECDSIEIDDHDGAYNATDHLIKSGCKNIVFVNPIGDTSVAQKRKEGFLDALKDAGLEPKSFTSTIENLEEELAQYLKENTIDAILAVDELSGVRSINSAISAGFSIPDQLSVIGFTDGILSQNHRPSLSTVNQRGTLMGREAVKLAINRLENPTSEIKRQIIKTELLLRDSTRKA
ncbi:MAG: LacI family transcriptional regulator [Cytophagaceae bacterium]|nr:LacI family transcriptional regulator [Cytophagaceae bacterium]|tara:strand:- start:5598 stop:6602 length:1005 start_codon:yes stop_codon:yes gene_type:complete